MRIEFPNVAREDFHWTQAQLRIGSAPDNDLVLAATQCAPEHLCIRQDRRGLILQVVPAASRIYVNARPVHEQALLRAGDVISLGGCRMLLRVDQDPTSRSPVAVPQLETSTVALRAVAGPLSGRVMPLRDRLELGVQSRPPLELPQGEVAGLRFYRHDGQVLLESLQTSERYPLRVNGVIVQKLSLQPGDQIGVGMHRFVFDAPGMEVEPDIASNKLPLPTRPSAPEARPVREVWWLIVTAALLALGIALALLIHHR